MRFIILILLSLMLISKHAMASKELELISQHMVIEDVINPNGEGAIYLIGQIHYADFTYESDEYAIERQVPILPQVQLQIFNCLKDLVTKNNLNLVLDESVGASMNLEKVIGLKKSQIASQSPLYKIRNINPEHDNQQYMLELIKKNKRLSGPILLGITYPDLVDICGANDKNEISEIYTLKDIGLSIEKPILERRKQIIELNNKRSRIYMEEAIKKADELGKKDVAIVIGGAHLSLMAKEYSGKRKLYLLWPKKFYNTDIYHAFVYTEESEKFYMNGDWENAMSNITKAIAIMPKIPIITSLYVFRACLFAQKEKFEEAISDLRIALNIDPHDRMTRIMLGQMTHLKEESGRGYLGMV